MHYEPAAGIIRLLGGLGVVASATGVSIASVQRWRRPFEVGGTGGFIPRKHHQALLDLAEGQGIELPIAAFLDVRAVPQHERPKRAWTKHTPTPVDI